MPFSNEVYERLRREIGERVLLRMTPEERERRTLEALEENQEAEIKRLRTYGATLKAAEERLRETEDPEEREALYRIIREETSSMWSSGRDLGNLWRGKRALRREGWERHYVAAPRKNLPW